MNVFEKAGDKIKDAAECVKEKYKKISSSTEKKIKGKTKKYITEGTEFINKTISKLKKQIKNKPIIYTLLAVTTGFIIGFITRNKKK